MRLSGTFNLASKSKQELRGLYRKIFNKIADPKISKSERQSALHLLHRIQQQLGMRP
jgi:hypothetical protein